MNNEFLGIQKQTFNLLVLIIILVIFGIVSFNAYMVWTVKAKDKIAMSIDMGADVELNIPFLKTN